MKIAVIGAGAMGSIYGGHLAQHNEVYLVDTNTRVVEEINANGLRIDEEGQTRVYHPQAVCDTSALGPMDLVILFVKSIYSRAALGGNPALIGPDTRLMTLQNGAGHEDILADFAPREHIIIGTTEDNGAVLAPGHVRRGGEGRTNVGMLTPDGDNFLPRLQQAFDSCGFQVRIHENIQQLIWEKLFTNVSLSAVTGILQVDMGFIAADEYAWALTRTLLHEAVCTAAAAGLTFDEEALAEKVRSTSRNNPQGCTSIRADLAAGRRTEVDTISGAVVRAAGKYGVAVPCHEFVVRMVHAMEDRHKGGTV